jgi:RimJ/RimL family protein N-acetyltransferase
MTVDVVLRDVTEDDLPILFEHQLDPEATAMAAFPSRDRQAFFEHWRTRVFPDPANIRKAIVVDGEVVGNLVCWGLEGEREVGYWIGRERWGTGIATAAVRAFLEGYPERPLWAHAASRNVGSRRVLEKCGFAFVREIREPMVPGGEEVDVCEFRLD